MPALSPVGAAVASLSCLLMVSLAPAPALAQGPPADNPAKSQAYRFEMALRSAVEDGGRRLAQQALAFAPELRLEAAEPAVVRSFRLPGYGLFFDVQAPNITSTVMVWDMRRRLAPSAESNPVRPVSDGRVGAATAPVEPDPVVAAPPPFDANRAYTAFVREALMDALLDGSAVLIDLGPDESLTVAASGIDQPNANPLYRGTEDKLLLTIKASDLRDLRQGRITRDQAKQRVTQERSF
jgi:hypothetical protein